MKLNELLGTVELSLDIELYESSTEFWGASKEKLIKKDITVNDYYTDYKKELRNKYGNYKVIGIFITSDSIMQITIYKG